MNRTFDTRNPIKLFYKVRNWVSRFRDPEFRTFRKFEYKVSPTDALNDLKKLRYVRNLELAESGFINTALKEQLKRLRQQDLLFQKDRTIVPIGRMVILEGDTALRTILLGYCKVEDKNYLSQNKVHNCPVWHPNDGTRYLKLVAGIYPSTSDTLRIEHRYFHQDVSYLDQDIQQKTLAFFNTALQTLYLGNKCFQNGVQEITPPIDGIKQLSLGLPIQMADGPKGLYVPIAIQKDYVTLVPYLAVGNDQNRVYLSAEAFRSLLGEKSIVPFAETKMGLSLGTFDDRLFLKATASERFGATLEYWTALDDFLEAKNVSKRLKYMVVQDVIKKKDFFVKTDDLPVPGAQIVLELYTHYGSGKTFYALNKNEQSPKPEAYRPITSLKDHYPQYDALYKASCERAVPLKTARSPKQKTFHL